MALPDRFKELVYYEHNRNRTKIAGAPGVSFAYINCLPHGGISLSLAILKKMCMVFCP
jgi:hypothetical protein